MTPAGASTSLTPRINGMTTHTHCTVLYTGITHDQSERPMTFETGEDFHISHTMRKYANIGTYVMPYKPDDEETKGSKYRGLSFVSAATTSRQDEIPTPEALTGLEGGGDCPKLLIIVIPPPHRADGGKILKYLSCVVFCCQEKSI